MSQKWIRSKHWDDKHLRAPALRPVWIVLRAFSSIPLAVCLLSLVAVYGILASVPIGLIALAPTYLIYALTFIAAIALGAVLPTWIISRSLRGARAPGAARFVVTVVSLVALTLLSAWLWHAYVWPRVQYEELVGGGTTGFRLFASFVDRYKSVQFRRLPMMEMSELEFYAWWPLRMVLILFVTNMVTATVRRIEFSFVNLGVLTVHSGIVTIALGSVVYSNLKQEGDMVLLSGPLDDKGKPQPGPAQNGFFDNTAVALWATHNESLGWEQRKLEGVPRYNDYNLDALGFGVEPNGAGDFPVPRDLGPISIGVPVGPPPAARIGGSVPGDNPGVDSDLRFRIVGYASYAELAERWVSPGTDGQSGGSASATGTALREAELYFAQPDPATGRPPTEPQKRYRFLPDIPADRIDVLEVLGVEYVRGMSEQRWADLSSPLPRGARHALVIEVPEQGFSQVFAAMEGADIPVGGTGWTVQVKSLSAQPPFPIITAGYQGSTSSVAVLQMTPPPSSGGAPFERWVYHRFPEISQDLSTTLNERGMPTRKPADPAIRVRYIDASIIQVYLDERPDTGLVRGLVRLPGGQAQVTPALKQNESLQIAPSLTLKLTTRTDNAVRVEQPRVVPEQFRNKQEIGAHKRAAIAVEVSQDIIAKHPWKQTVWLPFTQYMGVQADTLRTVTLPDGRRLTLAFARVRHVLPMKLRLLDFSMTPFPGSDIPKDFRSDVLVMSNWNGLYRDEVHKTSLNEPLLVRVPFQKRDDVITPMNWFAWALSHIIPTQYKFAQAGWDAEGWKRSGALVAAGQMPRQIAGFTILGVGNNPGIYVIACGAVMMSVGIPWAFYVKPTILRWRKKRIQAQLAAGEMGGRKQGREAQEPPAAPPPGSNGALEQHPALSPARTANRAGAES